MKSNKTRAQPDYINNNQLTYIPIPKCASTLMRTTLFQHGWQWAKTPHKTTFTIIDDPINRWIRGIAQTYHNRPKWVQDIHQNFDSYVQQAWHDPHTQPQHWYITQNTKLFTLQNLSHLNNWLTQNNITLNWDPTKIHHPEGPQEAKTKTQLKQFIQTQLTETHKNHLKEYYKKDYQLLEKAECPKAPNTS